jgi:hypothetical protein
MSNRLSSWLNNRVPGAIIYGPQRFGKTRAIRFISRHLGTEYAKLPVIEFLANQYPRPSERVFFQDVLKYSGHSLIEQGTTSAKRNRAIEYLSELAIKSHWQRLVFLVDDAQRLQLEHYHWLMDIHNALDARQIHMSSFLVGQIDLKHIKSSFAHGSKHQIVGRFMVNEFQFKGIRSIEDLAFCLNSYDTGTEYPVGSGCSFTQYFFPKAFKQGWRLSSLHPLFWDAFVQIHQHYRLPPLTEIPMQYFCRTVERVLLENSDHENLFPDIPIHRIVKAIEFIEYQNVYQVVE